MEVFNRQVQTSGCGTDLVGFIRFHTYYLVVVVVMDRVCCFIKPKSKAIQGTSLFWSSCIRASRVTKEPIGPLESTQKIIKEHSWLFDWCPCFFSSPLHNLCMDLCKIAGKLRACVLLEGACWIMLVLNSGQEICFNAPERNGKSLIYRHPYMRVCCSYH